ncbi:MAG: hypothetical protein Q9182_003904 [Xanthomendoza sp. 2 TL-2023]
MSSIPPYSSATGLTQDKSTSEGVLLTRIGRWFSRKPFLRHAPFPFLKLPAELRNMIYRLSLGQGATSKHCGHLVGCINIMNMKRGKYYAKKAQGRAKLRSPYLALDEPSHMDIDWFHRDWLSWDSPPFIIPATTYTLADSAQLPGIGLLAVNTQVRSETLPIFYSENHFVFDKTATIVPFMKDRTIAARRLIRRIDFTLYINQSDGFHYERQAEYAKTFQYISRSLDLKQLELSVINATTSLKQPFKTSAGPKKQWLHTLSEIQGLDALKLHLHLPRYEEFLNTLSWDASVFDLGEGFKDEIKALRSRKMAAELWLEDYLKSRMLRKKRVYPLDKWLSDHVCTTDCDEIAEGRRATRLGLPPSDTRGQWTLPEVDLDALYDSTDPDNSNEEEHDRKKEGEEVDSSDSKDDFFS